MAVEGLGEPASPAAIPVADAEAEGPLHPVWTSPAKMPPKLASKAFLDFQNDVKVADVQLAANMQAGAMGEIKLKAENKGNIYG